MEKIKLIFYNYKKYIIAISLIIVVILFSLSYIFIEKDDKKKIIINNDIVPNLVFTQSEYQEEKEINYIAVDIKGKVAKPGLYRIDNSLDKRVNDVIVMAGGLLKDADVSVTNLSKKLKDEMVIIIYSKDEVNNYLIVKEEEKKKEELCHSKENDSCINEEINENISNEKININTATLEELQVIPGIGESKAKDIIDYRNQNGLFQKIEDLMNISGIGEKTFIKFKDYIKV